MRLNREIKTRNGTTIKGWVDLFHYHRASFEVICSFMSFYGWYFVSDDVKRRSFRMRLPYGHTFALFVQFVRGTGRDFQIMFGFSVQED